MMKYYKVFENAKYIGVTMTGLLTNYQKDHNLILAYDGKNAKYAKRSDCVLFEIPESTFDELTGLDKFIPIPEICEIKLNETSMLYTEGDIPFAVKVYDDFIINYPYIVFFSQDDYEIHKSIDELFSGCGAVFVLDAKKILKRVNHYSKF